MPRVTKVYGPPGTGKTTWMLNKLEEELESGTSIERIAYLTFSVAAKNEAKERALARFPDLPDGRFKYFKTIHGICYAEIGIGRNHVMQTPDFLKFGKECPIEFSDQFTEDYDIDGNPFGWSTAPGNRILNIRQVSSSMMRNPFDPDFIHDHWPDDTSAKEVRYVLEKYAKFKEDYARFDFVDMLELYASHGDPLPVDAVFVDEAQDLTELQWQLVNLFAKEAKRLYIAGDDDQAIYTFLGSSQYGFLEYPADDVIILDRTYRLRHEIWNHATRIINPVRHRQAKQVHDRGVGGRISWWGLSADSILDRIPLDDVMVIGSTNYQLASLKSKLDAAGIPTVYKGQSITGGPAAVRFYWYHQARKGAPVPIKNASAIVRGLKLDGWKPLAERARTEPGATIAPAELEGLGVRFMASRACCDYLAFGPSDRARNDTLYGIALKYGLDAVIAQPKIRLTTYHGSKGAEATRVILITDCSPRAMLYAARNPDYERRLAYVGVTRAKEEIHISRWQTDSYMKVFT